jgi:hypothetical protein
MPSDRPIARQTRPTAHRPSLDLDIGMQLQPIYTSMSVEGATKRRQPEHLVWGRRVESAAPYVLSISVRILWDINNVEVLDLSRGQTTRGCQNSWNTRKLAEFKISEINKRTTPLIWHQQHVLPVARHLLLPILDPAIMTVKKLRFFNAYGARGPTDSLRSIAREYAPSLPTAH